MRKSKILRDGGDDDGAMPAGQGVVVNDFEVLDRFSLPDDDLLVDANTIPEVLVLYLFGQTQILCCLETSERGVQVADSLYRIHCGWEWRFLFPLHSR